MGSPTFSWWAAKVRQFRAHLGARVRPDERAALATWLTPAQLGPLRRDARRRPAPRARRRRDPPRRAAPTDVELLLAGLLHDCRQGPTVGVWPRVAWSLGEAYGAWVVARRSPPARLRPRRSTGCAITPSGRRSWPLAAGCSPRDGRPDPPPGRPGRRRRPASCSGSPTRRTDDARSRRPARRRAIGGPRRPVLGRRVRDPGPARGVRGSARAAAVAHRGASARRPDGAARRAGRRPTSTRWPGSSPTGWRTSVGVRGDRRPAHPHQEPGDAAATGRSGAADRADEPPDPEAALRARLIVYRAHRDAGQRAPGERARAGRPVPARAGRGRRGRARAAPSPSPAPPLRSGAARGAPSRGWSGSCRRPSRRPRSIAAHDHDRGARRGHPGGAPRRRPGRPPGAARAASATGSCWPSRSWPCSSS